jgi:hypothetical protein
LQGTVDFAAVPSCIVRALRVFRQREKNQSRMLTLFHESRVVPYHVP